jgi:hypothetical protein
MLLAIQLAIRPNGCLSDVAVPQIENLGPRPPAPANLKWQDQIDLLFVTLVPSIENPRATGTSDLQSCRYGDFCRSV